MTVLLIQLSKCYTRWNTLKRGEISEDFSKVLPPLWWDLQVHERLKFPVPPVEGCTTIACWFLQGSPVGGSWEIQVSTESSYHCEQTKLPDHNIWQFWQVCLVVHQGAIVAIGKGVEEVQVGSMWSIFQILKKWKWKCCKREGRLCFTWTFDISSSSPKTKTPGASKACLINSTAAAPCKKFIKIRKTFPEDLPLLFWPREQTVPKD